jgi:histidinol-phosphatase (PHP family)
MSTVSGHGTPIGGRWHGLLEAISWGLPAIAFTEHLDHTVWTVDPDGLSRLPHDDPVSVLTGADGRIAPPAFDVPGYLEAVEHCRSSFPDLRVLSGLEIGEPHWHAEAVRSVLEQGPFDLVLGSLHCLPDRDRFQEPGDLYLHRDARQVVRDYLAEVALLVAGTDVFSVLAHIDYPVRAWPKELGPFDATEFEEEFRHALRTTAAAGRALEINTIVPLDATIVRWWYDEGGQAVTFGSDAHEPAAVARGFAAASALAEAYGFRPTADLFAPWRRT